MGENDLNKNQIEANLEKVNSVERTGWFSGAAFALSLTLIGYIFSKRELVILLNFGHLRCILITSWIFLLLSIVASLLPRMLNANWLFFSSWNAYLKKFTTFDSDDLRAQHTELLSISNQKSERFSTLLKYVSAVVYLGTIIGISGLVLFIIKLVLLV